MNQKISIPPPKAYETFRPSELFRFFFQIGRWTEESFSLEFQNYARGKSISTVTVNKWKNKNVIPTRYTASFFKLIEGLFETDIADQWVVAFETVWAHQAARPKQVLISNNNVPAPSTISDQIYRQHADWIQTEYSRYIMGESFSVGDIYVPLQLIEEHPNACVLYEPQDLESFAETGWRGEENVDWTFINGGPGSGKSILALHLANRLSTSDIFSIYMRATKLSSISIDITDPTQHVTDAFSLDSFLLHFRASSYSTACVILDGIDEISVSDETSHLKRDELFSRLKSEQEICSLHGKTLRAILLGRAEITNKVSQQHSKVKVLRMVAMDGQVKLSNTQAVDQVGRDLRAQWWSNYISAKKLAPCTNLPEFLCAEYNEFSEFGAEPLLAHMICRTAFSEDPPDRSIRPANEIVDQITYEKNINSIYRKILKHLKQQDILNGSASETINLENPISTHLLQCISLASWHNGGQKNLTPIQIKAYIQDNKTRQEIRSLMSSYVTLHAAFPERKSAGFNHHIGKKKNGITLGFTHQSIVEYVLSTLFLDAFVTLITAFNSQDNFNEAIFHWITLCQTGPQESSLATFCQNEAALRYDSLIKLDWNAALTLLKEPFLSNEFNGSTKNLPDFIDQIKSAGSFIFLIWSALNVERYKRENVSFLFSDTEGTFGPADLRRIQLSTAMSSGMETLTDAPLYVPNFLAHSLSAIHLTSADMSRLSFNTGYIENTICDETNFAMTSWNHIRIMSSVFKRSFFQHTAWYMTELLGNIYRDCLFQFSSLRKVNFFDTRIKDTQFAQCHFTDVDFSLVNMSGVIFDRCIFVNSRFNFTSFQNASHAANFRHCTFVDMEAEFNQIPESMLEDCKQGNTPKGHYLPSNIERSYMNFKNNTLKTQQ